MSGIYASDYHHLYLSGYRAGNAPQPVMAADAIKTHVELRLYPPFLELIQHPLIHQQPVGHDGGKPLFPYPPPTIHQSPTNKKTRLTYMSAWFRLFC